MPEQRASAFANPDMPPLLPAFCMSNMWKGISILILTVIWKSFVCSIKADRKDIIFSCNNSPHFKAFGL
jgi:hypothetical protein